MATNKSQNQLAAPVSPVLESPTPEVKVRLQPPVKQPTDDQALWVAIRNRTEAISFARYSQFIDRLFCSGTDSGIEEGLEGGTASRNKVLKNGLAAETKKLLSRPSIYGVDSYEVLRLATEVFLLLESGLVGQDGKLMDPDLSGFRPGDLNSISTEESERVGATLSLADLEEKITQYFGSNPRLPYLSRILEALLGTTTFKESLPYCHEILNHRFSAPSLLELIWSYWYEEGMLVQTMGTIALRFQNQRGPMDRDPLAQLEIDPLRPLNNLLWGYVQSQYKRLTIQRRAYEYDHHYGITLYGKAVPSLRSADSRSKFLAGFHNLLYRTSLFYREDADTTVASDGFPVMTSLKEVHLSLAEGAHNQFGDLPWTARVEMLIEQWLLARPEMREFLRGRAMVPYLEAWMGQVDAMKKLQQWDDTTITHFGELAVFGEKIILSIRYGDWIGVNDQDQARNWARYWKPEIQSYIHAYRVVTGVNLTSEPVDATLPSIHLKKREDERKALRVGM